jgi:hypothetical protein
MRSGTFELRPVGRDLGVAVSARSSPPESESVLSGDEARWE